MKKILNNNHSFYEFSIKFILLFLLGNGELAFLSRTVLYAVSLFSGVGTLMNFIENYVIAQTESPQQMTYERSQYLHFLKLKSDPEIVAGNNTACSLENYYSITDLLLLSFHL